MQKYIAWIGIVTVSLWAIMSFQGRTNMLLGIAQILLVIVLFGEVIPNLKTKLTP